MIIAGLNSCKWNPFYDLSRLTNSNETFFMPKGDQVRKTSTDKNTLYHFPFTRHTSVSLQWDVYINVDFMQFIYAFTYPLTHFINTVMNLQ